MPSATGINSSNSCVSSPVSTLPPLACVDVDYHDDAGRCACLTFDAYTDEQPLGRYVIEVAAVADYQPGQFYLRELPAILAILGELPIRPRAIIVDGYVWLGPGTSRPGLGAHLYRALAGEVPVIGVAKSRFSGAPAESLLRGSSKRPLFVTSAGIPQKQAAAAIRGMHGTYRLPTLLKQVDRLCRDGLPSKRSGQTHPKA